MAAARMWSAMMKTLTCGFRRHYRKATVDSIASFTAVEEIVGGHPFPMNRASAVLKVLIQLLLPLGPNYTGDSKYADCLTEALPMSVPNWPQ